MLRVGSDLQLSATDLVGHLACTHLTSLDLEVANGRRAKFAVWDPLLEVLQQRGLRHEAAYIEHLRASGLAIVEIAGKGVDDVSVAATWDAMRSAAPIIVQAAMRSGAYAGRADILRRIEAPSRLGAWSYEVIDTKLARETKGGTILQLCLYSELLGDVQGLVPEFTYVVAPFSDFVPERFRVADYSAYFRNAKDRFGGWVARKQATYPEPVANCETCRWRIPCDDRRRSDDHLSLVAGISSMQRHELVSHNISTMAALANTALPLEWKPERGSAASYDRVREQARIQVEGRVAGRLLHEMLTIEPGFGLCRLPEPDDGDIFFDLEGDPFAAEGGLEYLFGYTFKIGSGEFEYSSHWSFSPAEEKAAFERFIDFVMERRRSHPNLHIYHYAPYEPGALKRLMGRYATREEEVDSLLRGRVLIDLYAVVRHSIRASVESYSIKRLEPLYGFGRLVPLADANAALGSVQVGLEFGDAESIGEADRVTVAGYNADDCRSTMALRDWLEGLRAQALVRGLEVPRPNTSVEEASAEVSAWQAKVDDLVKRLTDGIPVDAAERTSEQQATHVLAYILDWHRREKKASWWEFFRLSGLSDDELVDEKRGLSGLTFIELAGGTAKAPIHRYSFPSQDAEFRGGEDLFSAGGAKLGRVHAIDFEH